MIKIAPLTLKDGKVSQYKKTDGRLLGGVNFSFKRISNETITIEPEQQMIVCQEIEVNADGELEINGDGELVVMTGGQ